MLDDLAAALEPGPAPALLVIFDLDATGLFDAHASRVRSEALLRRLSAQLSKLLGPLATCYRPREAELAALIHLSKNSALALVAATASTLAEDNSELNLTVSFGVAVLPDEAADTRQALILADKRVKAHAKEQLGDDLPARVATTREGPLRTNAED